MEDLGGVCVGGCRVTKTPTSQARGGDGVIKAIIVQIQVR